MVQISALVARAYSKIAASINPTPAERNPRFADSMPAEINDPSKLALGKLSQNFPRISVSRLPLAPWSNSAKTSSQAITSPRSRKADNREWTGSRALKYSIQTQVSGRIVSD